MHTASQTFLYNLLWVNENKVLLINLNREVPESLSEWDEKFEKSIVYTSFLILTYQNWSSKFISLLKEMGIESNIPNDLGEILTLCDKLLNQKKILLKSKCNF